MKRGAKLFVSYSHEDARLADEVASICKTLGVRCFLDRKDINWGQSIRMAIGRGLEEATHVLVIVSPASLKSGWVPFEVGFATGKGKLVLPLLVHPSLDLPGYLGDPLHKAEGDLKASLRQALLKSPTPTAPLPSGKDSDWVAALHTDLLETTAVVEGHRLSSHDVFIAVFDGLLTGIPAERFAMVIASRLKLPGNYYSSEATSDPFGALLAPLVTNELVRCAKEDLRGQSCAVRNRAWKAIWRCVPLRLPNTRCTRRPMVRS